MGRGQRADLDDLESFDSGSFVSESDDDDASTAVEEQEEVAVVVEQEDETENEEEQDERKRSSRRSKKPRPPVHYCTAFGLGLHSAVCGEWSSFTVSVHDESGVPVQDKKLELVARLESASHLYLLTVKDQRDGSYTVRYRVSGPVSEEYELSIVLRKEEEEHVGGSPFTLRLKPGSASVVTSILTASDHQVAVTSTLTDRIMHFKVEARDAFGNALEAGGDPYEARVDGGRLVSFTDDGDGSYTGTCEGSSDAVVRAYIAGDEIRGSPMALIKQQKIVVVVVVEEEEEEEEEEGSEEELDWTEPEEEIVLTISPVVNAIADLARFRRDRAARALILAADAQLADLFAAYSHVLFGSYIKATRCLALEAHFDDRSQTQFQGLVNLATDFDLLPSLISWTELRVCYSAAQAAAYNPAGLTYDQFLDLVLLLALAAFGKPAFAATYRATAEKVQVLLDRWGLADSVRLERIVKNRHYHI